MENWKLFKETINFSKLFIDENCSIEIIYDSFIHKTDLYDQKVAVIRRGTHFKLKYESNNGQSISANNIFFQISTSARTKTEKFALSNESPKASFFSYTVEEKQSNSVRILLSVDANAAIGFYALQLMYQEKIVGIPLKVYIIFNPMNVLDSVYCVDPMMISQYLLTTSIKVYSGSKNYQAAIKYNIGQFSIECMSVCIYFLEKMSLSDRQDPILVSRAISAYVNGNDDHGLIYGSWSEKTDGTSPTAWTNAEDIYSEYLKSGSPVKWGQCFVFSMLVTSMCRNIGILSKSVSGFEIAHDENKDGIITIYLEENSMKSLSTSETLWNFHAWNNILITRNDIKIDESTSAKRYSIWQHLDGTPQERSEGIYQCGPYPVELLARDIYNRSIPYDGDSVYYSINYKVENIIMGKGGNIVNKTLHEKSCDLIVSTDVFNKKQEITREYKSYRTLEDNVTEKPKIKLELNIPLKMNINDPIHYEILVEGGSVDSPTILSLLVELQNNVGKSILDMSGAYKSIIFERTSYNLTHSLEHLILKNPIDLSLAVIHWELRCYDRFTNVLQTVEKSSVLLPPITAQVEVNKRFVYTGDIPLKLKINNKTNLDIENSVIIVSMFESKQRYTRNVPILASTLISDLSMNIPIDKPGYYTLYFHIQSNIYNGKLAKEKILTFIQ